MKHFKFYGKNDILSLTKSRKFETKVGEAIAVMPEAAEWPEALLESDAKYVLIGIPEDIGVRANYGNPGADTNWYPFLNAFLNVQSNDFFSGEDVLLLGHFDFGDIKYLIENNAYNDDEKIEAYRHAVTIIDDEVETIIKTICGAGKIPIVVGGGHNNAYPLIKGAAKGLHKFHGTHLAQINCINLDAHSDYRPLEGRHSGNAFRYAEEDGFLGKYAIIGIHENYVSQNILTELNNNPFIHYSTYEEIFIAESKNFTQSISHAIGFTEDNYCGIELDLDSVSNVLCSAPTTTGITALQARTFINFVATDTKLAYFHISEGACQTVDGKKDDLTGKLISQLVCDFVKATNKQL